MAFDLAVNVQSFPKCNVCGHEMALVKVYELEMESDKEEGGSPHGHSFRPGLEKSNSDAAYFTWKCSCGNIISAHAGD
ncbi:MAG: hypothetical protein HYY37_06775 [Candidatus Aenigmarchaeota archaeon]|nr:hypothetical protein [Candidatus Aenigmarchaeota archaeon]